MAKIKSLTAREIIDSRGNPTIEVHIVVDNTKASASVPSGASTGTHEAWELRDGDTTRYNGKGVLQAVKNCNEEIAQAIIEKEFNQTELDNFLIMLDGTENKKRLGSNTILGVSLAFARAMAQIQNVELYQYLGSLGNNSNFQLPNPMFNIINGGLHADSGLDIQEFMIGPIGIQGFSKKVQAASEIIASLRTLLKKDGYTIGLGDEGGFAPKLASNESVFEYLEMAITNAGYTTDTIKIGIDAAASSFYKNGAYNLKIDSKASTLTEDELIAWYTQLVHTKPIISIEDGLSEESWQGFAKLTQALGNKVDIIGDDLLVTNVSRMEIAKQNKSITSALIKPNQIGTLTETINAILFAKKNGWKTFISHRSGETTDTFIADLAVGLSCEYAKFGSLARGERVCKYNRLMEIETILTHE